MHLLAVLGAVCIGIGAAEAVYSGLYKVTATPDFFFMDLSGETYSRGYSLKEFSRFFLAGFVSFNMSHD